MLVRTLLFACCLGVIPQFTSAQEAARPDELAAAKASFERWFGDAADPAPGLFPGSLLMDGKATAQSPDAWKREISPALEKDGVLRRTLTLTHPASGLVVRYEGVRYLNFPAIEWTAYYKNTGAKDSPLLQDLKSIDAAFPEFAGQRTVLHRNKGDNCTADSFEPVTGEFAAGTEEVLANTGGRPTQITFPFFNFERDNGGLIFSLSWAGQWSCRFNRDADGTLRLQGGQELTRFILHPGEEVRGPMVVLQHYTGEKRRGQNLWRQWMIAHNLPRPNGNPPPLPMMEACSSHHYGEMINANTENQKMFVEKYEARGIHLDYWWMDAGWYPCDGQWPKTGTWEIDETRFPGGFKPINDFAHGKNVKIVVWFEPERVHKDTWLTKNHPEWILGGRDGGLLNLGNPEARDWLINHVDGLLTSQGIDLYRQDFNMDPLKFWRDNDTPDRQGITEIRHVEGYFAYWNALRERHPDMLIDSCASGGRRNDLETLRRAVPLLRSDYIMEPVGNQCHTWALAEWFPFFGTGTSKTSDYEIMSVLCPSFNACWDQRNEDINWPRMKELVDQWRAYGVNYFGDYYPLTPYSLDKNAWIAWQFNRAAEGAGMVQAFRRDESGTDGMRLPLSGLDSGAKYRVTPLRQGTAPVEMTGAELMKDGIPLSIPEKPGALFVLYEAVK